MINTYSKSTLALLIGSILASEMAVAQQVPAGQDEPLEVIDVKGFRSSLIKAKDLKREALISRDSILAEDVADFPDLNLADSLQRIAGVTITREGGEGRQISLRGLGPDFTRVQVNGMEALGTSASPMDSRGAVSRSRAFDFNIFASELFNRIDVNKSYSADQEEGGIGGTVGLFTAKPFEYDGFTSAVNVRGNYNDVAEQTDPRIAAMVSNTWDKFGALFSVAYSERHTTEYGTNATRWRKETGKSAAEGSSQDGLQALLDSGELWFPRGHRYSMWNNQQKRLGMTAALQYRPSSDLEFTLDLMHGKLENNQDEHHNAVKDNKTVSALEYVENNGQKEVLYAAYENATWRAENSERYNESVFDQATLTTEWTINNDLGMVFLIGTSSSDFDMPKLQKSNIHAKRKADIVTDFRQDRHYGLSYSNHFDVTDYTAYTIKDLYFEEDFISSDFDTAKVDFDYSVGDTGMLRFGYNHKKFTNSGYQASHSNIQKDAPQNAGAETLSADLVNLFTDHPDSVWVQGDIDALRNYFGLDGYRLSADDINETSQYQVSEQTDAAYVQYDLEQELAGHPLQISIGARYYTTELTSAGISQGEFIETSRDYSGLLPSLNMVYNLNDEMLVRFGASKNLTRPSLSSEAYYASVSQTSGDEITSISMGNPALDPFESVNLDAAFEWYFEEVGLFSAAIFYKDIDNFIVNRTTEVVYSDTGLPAELLPADKTVDSVFYLSTPMNMDSSTIKGAELAFSRDLDFLPAPFDNLGVIANYTYADGEALYRSVYGEEGNDQYKPFSGLSKNSYNFTLYYEQQDFGGRISAVYRSKYLADASSNGDQDESGFNATTYVDASFFYQINDKVKVTLEGMNLTDQREEQYSDSHDRGYNSTYSGRTYSLGISARF